MGSREKEGSMESVFLVVWGVIGVIILTVIVALVASPFFIAFIARSKHNKTIKAVKKARDMDLPLNRGDKISFWNGKRLEVGFVKEVKIEEYVVRCKYSDNEIVKRESCFNIQMWEVCKFNDTAKEYLESTV
jgi:hypothetical protein